MNLWDGIILGAVLLLLALAISILRKGKGRCSGSCEGCKAGCQKNAREKFPGQESG